MTLNCFERKMEFSRIKMEFKKIANSLETTFDDKELPKFLTKN